MTPFRWKPPRSSHGGLCYYLGSSSPLPSPKRDRFRGRRITTARSASPCNPSRDEFSVIVPEMEVSVAPATALASHREQAAPTAQHELPQLRVQLESALS